MTTLSRSFLIGSCVFAAIAIIGVHYKQHFDREKLHSGVVRELHNEAIKTLDQDQSDNSDVILWIFYLPVQSRCTMFAILVVLYFCFFLDNLLLTAIGKPGLCSVTTVKATFAVSIFFDELGQKSLFLLIAFLAIGLYVFENIFVTFPQVLPKYYQTSIVKVIKYFLTDTVIWVIFGAIFTSSLTTAALETTLPEWLLEWKSAPAEWQLGLVFLPDTFGYFLATNCLGLLFDTLLNKSLRWVVGLFSLLFLGLSAFLFPILESMWQILLPHFSIGFSIGLLDAALMPLLADFVHFNFVNDFGQFEIIYSLQEIVISLAYIIGNIVSVEIVKVFSFPFLIHFIGLLNILYCPFLFILKPENV